MNRQKTISLSLLLLTLSVFVGYGALTSKFALEQRFIDEDPAFGLSRLNVGDESGHGPAVTRAFYDKTYIQFETTAQKAI